MGHTRLKIIDLDDRSNQPFYSRDGRYVLIFNGEIYNFRELAKEHNIQRKTTSDTEIVIELYAKFGPKCLGWLNGMFSLIVFDTVSRETFAARDRLGVKPLYMRRNGESFTFASEIAPILKLSGTSRLDQFGVRQYRKLRACFGKRTIYEGIEMFPAGHYFYGGKLQCYWQLPEAPQIAPTDEELRGLTMQAVEQRLISDVPVGSYLSGGVDSTIVAALSHRPDTWTVGFKEHNEFEWGRIAANHIHSVHHEVLMSPEEFVELARLMIQKRCEPLSVPNEVLLYKMTSEVKKHNTVILSGEGADELFFGYDRIFRWAAQAKTWDLAQFTSLYAYGTVEDPEVVEDAIAPFVHRETPIEIVAHFFQVGHLHALLRRLDNSTMLCSVEARVPFVDYHPLIERMAGVPFNDRLIDGVVKGQLKRAFSDLVPSAIRERDKVGFPVPLQTIPFGGDTALSPMDRWLEFNLAELKC
jgi:asparagine synthase (glutamine-hydrolysing)